MVAGGVAEAEDFDVHGEVAPGKDVGALVVKAKLPARGAYSRSWG